MVSLINSCKNNENIRQNLVDKLITSVTQESSIENGIQISVLKRTDKEAYGLVMYSLIKSLMDYFKRIRKTDNDNEIFKIINLISKEFFYMKVDEVAYCFQQIMTGKYVVILDALDGGIILKGLRIYDSTDRLMYLENKHLGYKSSNTGNLLLKAQQQENEKPFDKEKFYQKAKERFAKESIVKQEDDKKELEYKKFKAEYILKERMKMKAQGKINKKLNKKNGN